MSFPIQSSWSAIVAVLLAGTVFAEEPVPAEGAHGGEDSEEDSSQADPPVTSHSGAPTETLLACIQSHENAQLARLSGGFLEALNQLTHCSDRVCPEALREDCLRWHAEMQGLIPGIIIVVRTPTGDIDDARVLVDGHLVRERLDGRKLLLDPGKHLIRVEGAGGLADERSLVLAEGEGTRRVVFEFRNGTVAETDSAPSLPHPTARPVPALSYVLGGTALVSLGIFVGFGVSALNASEKAQHTCAPVCDPSVTRAVNERAIVADVALGVSALSLVGAVLVYAYRPEVSVANKSTSLDVRVSRDGGHIVLGGEF